MPRYRATVVIIRDNKILLVRDKGKKDYSLPGGGFKKDETTIQAGIREACIEELGGLTVVSAERLYFCDLPNGRRANHKVCRLTVKGDPYIKRTYEIDKIVWWDMNSKIPIQGHVKYIVSILKERGIVKSTNI